MFLHTALSSSRKCLSDNFQIQDSLSEILDGESRTLAISLQLLPASRMAFNLCSSSAVHGVFVRPFFFGAGSWATVVATVLTGGSVVTGGGGGAVIGTTGPGCGDIRRLRGFWGGIGGAVGMSPSKGRVAG